ncbi:MAG: hypothetical protein O3B25_02760 [Verrucomicrobia bacterium]|nr:hypothetical protein [Verrucomicrobiota bacterium]
MRSLSFLFNPSRLAAGLSLFLATGAVSLYPHQASFFLGFSLKTLSSEA